MSAVTLKRMAAFKRAATMFAFEVQESLGRLAFRLARSTAHRQPQQVQ